MAEDNNKFEQVSFSSSDRMNAPRIIKNAAETGDEFEIIKALEPWGEDRKEVIEAIAKGDFDVQGSHVVVRLSRHGETKS